MPTYEYLCQTCSHRFETWQKMSENPLTTCPECGSHVRRVLYPAGVVFKGSGFYKTDHGNSTLVGDSNGENKKTDSPSEGSSTSTTDTKSKSECSAPASSASSANSATSESKSTTPPTLAGTK
jgi:putative FmdB family regulatory protein